jgi:hypothetical protein
MPVIKIFYDETLDPKVRNARGDIQAGLEAMMRENLAADPTKCQVVLCASMHVTPLPVYVDMQYRANDYRTAEVVAGAMRKTADVLTAALGAGVRIRAFDIDQATLHALDINDPKLAA